jgi:hypothetical protein
MPSLAQAIVWIIVGLLGGSLAALMIIRERKGFGILRNLGIGLVGARRRPVVPHVRDFPRPRQRCSLAAGCRRRAYQIIARPCCDRAMAALQEITVIATEEKLKRIATARAGKR